MYAAATVKWAERGRLLKVPQVGARESYQDMADFVDTVSNERAQGALEAAIQGKGAFRRFKDTLIRYPQERDRWFEFLAARTRERVLSWLREEEIEPVGMDGKPHE